MEELDDVINVPREGPKKTGRDGTGSDDRGMKPAGGDIIVERGTPQLNVQELGQEQHEHEWQEAISELEGETQGALSDHGEDTQEVLSEDEREQQHEEEGAEARSASLEGPTVPALRKLAIDGNVPPILSSRTRSRKPHTGVEGGALHVSCRRSRPKKKTAWRMCWHATTEARWLCKRR